MTQGVTEKLLQDFEEQCGKVKLEDISVSLQVMSCALKNLHALGLNIPLFSQYAGIHLIDDINNEVR